MEPLRRLNELLAHTTVRSCELERELATGDGLADELKLFDRHGRLVMIIRAVPVTDEYAALEIEQPEGEEDER